MAVHCSQKTGVQFIDAHLVDGAKEPTLPMPKRSMIPFQSDLITEWGAGVNAELDQGWWPEGLRTPPSDDAMLFDIEWLKSAGFNMIRKHIKSNRDGTTIRAIDSACLFAKIRSVAEPGTIAAGPSGLD